MKKTLGGDRLSSGRKMQVNLHAYQRSTHNKSYVWRNTQSPGTIVPFMVQVMTPGSTADIELDMDVMTHPTIGPLFGSFKLDAHVFACPVRLYHAWLHNNKLKIGMNMASVKLPQLRLTAKAKATGADDNLDNTQINPSCLLAYLGIRGIGAPPASEDATRDFNALPLLAYWDIYKNYYANKQEEIGAVIRGSNLAITETIDSITINAATLPEAPTVTPINLQYGQAVVINYTGTAPLPSQILVRITGMGGDQLVPLPTLSNNLVDDPGTTTFNGTVTNYIGNSALSWEYETADSIPLEAPKVDLFPLENIDTMRDEILQHNTNDPFLVNNADLAPYGYLLVPETLTGRNPRLNTQEGLAVKTYQSDLLNNWLNTEWIDGAGGVNEVSRIDTSEGFFTLDQLLMGRKIYDLMNRIGISGGTYKDWIEAAYTEIDWNKVESPVYWGGLIKELVFQEVVSNSAAPETNGQTAQPLGTLAGKGVLAKKHKGGKIVIKAEEHSYIIGLVSITPRIDYSQGNAWDIHLKTMDDFHKPAFDEIGFQELPTEQMAYWDTTWDATNNEWITKSAGKQPAWMNYMTEINKCFGNFAIENNEMFMTLNRRYERAGGEIGDLTTYIDPVKYNFIFADTSIDAMNFWVQIGVDYQYRAKMSGKLMPNL